LWNQPASSISIAREDGRERPFAIRAAQGKKPVSERGRLCSKRLQPTRLAGDVLIKALHS
jgi:hypothetical protein